MHQMHAGRTIWIARCGLSTPCYTLAMEWWFLAAVGGAIASGIGAFTIKVVAKNGYDSELYIFYSAVISVLLILPVAFWLSGWHAMAWGAMGFAFVGGMIAATVGIMKVYALRYIDTTIYFPLYKLLSPAFAILAGLLLFGERFSWLEWLGLLMGLFVPLVLITPAERLRQTNLTLGLILVGITSVATAFTAVFNQYAVNLSGGDVYWITVFTSLGIMLGAMLTSLYKRGWVSYRTSFAEHTTLKLLHISFWRSVVMSIAFILFLFGLTLGGDLGVVYTIYSLSILVPIVLAIYYYSEHWNWQKVAAVAFSVAALVLLG